MVLFLRFLFIAIIAAMLWATGTASLQQSLGDFARSATIRDPWVIATLFDAYFAFLAFFVWVAWKEGTMLARALWFIALMLLGNFAIAAFMLRELFAVPTTGPLTDVFTRRNPGHLFLPSLLTGLSVAVYWLA
ncbi:MAG: DUF1475 family protein [Candidatus Didemnitutus sp.]|nr:DUF1475 family protein [Candidatus Didemnitutus sp.]